MAIYSASVSIYQVASGTPAADFMTGQSNSPAFIEIGMQSTFATGQLFGIGRAAPAGTQLGGVNLLAEDAANTLPCQTTVATQWTIAPSVPANYLRRIQLPGTSTGIGMILTFPRGLSLDPNSSLVVWNIATNGGAVLWGQTDE